MRRQGNDSIVAVEVAAKCAWQGRELVGVGLMLPVAGAAVLAAEPVRKRKSIGATAEEAVPVLNYAMASPRGFLMGTCMIAFEATARPPPRRSSGGVCWESGGKNGYSGRCAGQET